jgi:hypothetical protein
MDDTNDCPAPRKEPCQNCGKAYAKHFGWACNDDDFNFKFSDLMDFEKYVTSDMIDSEGQVSVSFQRKPFKESSKTLNQVKPPIEDQSDDWRAWANNKPGECPCGIIRHLCTYHK